MRKCIKNVAGTMTVLRTESSLVQVMACHLFGAKSLPEPMLTYHELDLSAKNCLKMQGFSFKKFI